MSSALDSPAARRGGEATVSPSPAALRFVSATKQYALGETSIVALDALTLEVPRGQFIAVVGRSGSGKSTLLNLAAGIDTPSHGEVWVDGRELSKLSDDDLTRQRRDRVGMVLLPTYNFVLRRIDGVSGGNPALEPEEADTYTAGIVLESSLEHRWLGDLQLAIDWYRIDFRNGIGRWNTESAVTRCFDATFNPDFGQVEADPSALTLDGYQIFFEEKRPFFIEGRNIFNYRITGSQADGPFESDVLFYSRRIGGVPHGYPEIEDYE